MKNTGVITTFIAMMISTSAFAGEYLIYSKDIYKGGIMTTLPVDNTEACINAIKNISTAFKSDAQHDTQYLNYPRTFICIKSDGTVTKKGAIYVVPSQNNFPCVEYGDFAGWTFNKDRCSVSEYTLKPIILDTYSSKKALIDLINQFSKK